MSPPGERFQVRVQDGIFRMLSKLSCIVKAVIASKTKDTLYLDSIKNLRTFIKINFDLLKSIILISYFIDSSQNVSDQLTGNSVQNLFILNRHFQSLSMITWISYSPAEIWNGCDCFIQGDKSKIRLQMRLRILIFLFGSLIGRIQIGKRILKVYEASLSLLKTRRKHHFRSII